MRCREVRNEIDKILRGKKDSDLSRFEEHIKHCSKCRREYHAAVKLNEAFCLCAIDDATHMMAIEDRRKLVVAQAAARVEKQSALGFRHRRSYGKAFASFGVVTAAALVTLLTIIPFKYEKTIGYEVAFAGVDQELVEDNSIICELLYDLGLRDADVDIQGCNVTCSLLIIDLKSEAEAALVISAVNQFGIDRITSDVRPVRTSESSTILDRANKEILE